MHLLPILFSQTALAQQTIQLYGEEFPVETGSIVYIIDCSRSMDSQWQSFVDETGADASGYRIDRARAELARSVLQLDAGTSFDIVVFGGGVDPMWGMPRSADDGNVAEALSWISGLTAVGPTVTAQAVISALARPSYHAVRDFLIVTDDTPNCGGTAYDWADWPEHLNYDNRRACVAGGGSVANAKHQLDSITTVNAGDAALHVVNLAPDDAQATSFTTALAARNRGTYVPVE